MINFPDIGNLSGQALADFSPPGGIHLASLHSAAFPHF